MAEHAAEKEKAADEGEGENGPASSLNVGKTCWKNIRSCADGIDCQKDTLGPVPSGLASSVL